MDAVPSDVATAAPCESNGLILIAHRDPTATASLTYHLAKAGYHVTTASSAADVLQAARTKSPALLVLDPALSNNSGYYVLEQVRRDEQTHDLGVILFGSSRDEIDGVRGLALGADDCVVVPISAAELVLRVGAILRRRGALGQSNGRLLRAGSLVVDRAAYRVTVNGTEVAVTVTEFKLLAALIESDGRVCSRRQLVDRVWHVKSIVQTRTVDMHLQRLRRKLGTVGRCIETVRGAGYRLQMMRARATA